MTAEHPELQREIDFWQELVAGKEREVSSLSFDLQSLKVQLNVFLGEYNSRAGVLFLELDRAKLAAREYEYRLFLLQQKSYSIDEIRGLEEQVSTQFAQERARVQALDGEVLESAQQYEKYLWERESQSLTPEESEDIKRLYRQLALRYHPDRARDDASRRQCSGFMADINDAYRRNDVAALRAYMRRSERDAKISRETPHARLVRLKQEHKILLGIAIRLRGELDSLLSNETYKLRERVVEEKERGGDLITRIVVNVRRELETANRRLKELESRFNETLRNIEHCCGHLAAGSGMANFDLSGRKELVLRGLGALAGIKDADFYFAEAESHKLRGDMLSAIANYQKALELNPEHEEALFWLAYCYTPDVTARNPEMDNTACWEKAAALFEKLAMIKDRKRDRSGAVYAVFHNLGQAYYHLCRYDKAERSYSRAVELNRDSADSWYNLGIVESVLGFYDKSVNAFRRAIALNGGDASYYYNLAMVEDKLGQRRQAAANLRKYLELSSARGPASNRFAVFASKRLRELESFTEAEESPALGVSRHGDLPGRLLSRGSVDGDGQD